MSYSLESCPYLGETKDCVMHGSTCVQKCAALHASECTSVSHCHVHNDSCVENCGSMDATRCNASGHCHLLNGSCAEKCEVTWARERMGWVYSFEVWTCFLLYARSTHTSGNKQNVPMNTVKLDFFLFEFFSFFLLPDVFLQRRTKIKWNLLVVNGQSCRR